MKKQILFLTFFVTAIFAGNSAFGQTPIIAEGTPNPYVSFLTVTDNDPANVSCAVQEVLPCLTTVVTDHLHPLAGETYTYTVTTSDAALDAGGNPTQDRIHWFVINYNDLTAPAGIIDPINDIDNLNGIIDIGDGTGDFILSNIATGGVYNTPTQTANSIDITWKSFDGASNVVLLVAYAVDGTGCTDNIEVYRIMPQFKFTLDIAAINDAGAIIGAMQTSTAEECVSPIESATYVPGADATDGTLTVDYGENYLFFTVTATNFTHSWLPSFQTEYSGGVGPDGITVSWAYPDQAVLSDATTGAATGTWTTVGTANSGALTTLGGVSGTDVPVEHPDNDDTATPVVIGADDGTGECIVVRVRIDHGTLNENAEPNDRTFKLAVDGVMYDANATVAADTYANGTLADLGPDSDTTPDGICNADQFENDWVNYILTPRPQIETSTTHATQGLQYFELNSGDNTSGTPNDPNNGLNP
ncbi:hypothetical protein [Maribellus sp. YY47]|uniref:hypothetical protein n=1 Tax=Maribellus sp. YY47 TaxID=2929486 RepID=UPI002001BD0D|nr:hypothetical protein [Maribellus sp. YY47]MCK3684022.1 hypothetical protein [Maribellus sp. YY47]